MQSKAVFLLSTACFFASAVISDAQINRPQIPSRFTVGADFAVSQPKGEFASNVPTGYGFDFTGLLKLDPKGWFGIRGDVGQVRYGHEHVNLGFFGPQAIELDDVAVIDEEVDARSIVLDAPGEDHWVGSLEHHLFEAKLSRPS